MSDYRYQVIYHNGIVCLHVMIEIPPVNEGIAQCYIPMDDIQRSAWDRKVNQVEPVMKEHEHDA